MLSGLVRLIYYVFLAYLIYIIYKFFRNLSKRKLSSKARPRLSGMMVKDETCNMYVPKEEAIREVIGGKEFFFCSKECRQKFLAQRKTA